MGRILLVGGFVALVAAGAWLFAPGISPAHAGAAGGGGPAGLYLARFSVGGYPLIAVLTVHSDGTWTMSDQTDFGGIPGFDSTSAPWQGTWKFTGNHETTFTGLALNFNSSGFPTTVNRIVGVATWSDGFRKATVTTGQRVYGPSDDPLDPTDGTVAAPPLDDLSGAIRKMIE